MKKCIVLTLLVLLAGPAATSSANMQYLQSLSNTQYHRIDSRAVGRNFHVYVKLPDSYSPSSDSAYPTLYLLDGGGLFPLISAYQRYLTSAGESPEAIIVGIAYGGDSFKTGNFRSTDYTAPAPQRDYWGGAEKFQRFLADELIPLIERTYRSQSHRRIIFGQSLGGQFVLFTAQTRPELFWGHIASNPALHRNLAYFLADEAVAQTGALRSKLFVASGTLDDERYRQPLLRWMDYWSGKPTPWQLRTQHLQGHSHMSTPPAAFRQGMMWLFSGT